MQKFRASKEGGRLLLGVEGGMGALQQKWGLQLKEGGRKHSSLAAARKRKRKRRRRHILLLPPRKRRALLLLFSSGQITREINYNGAERGKGGKEEGGVDESLERVLLLHFCNPPREEEPFLLAPRFSSSPLLRVTTKERR